MLAEDTRFLGYRQNILFTQSTELYLYLLPFPCKSQEDDGKCLRYTQHTQWVYAKWGNLSLEKPQYYKSSCKQTCPISPERDIIFIFLISKQIFLLP